MADLVLEVIEGTDAGRQVELAAPVEIGRDQGLGLPLPQDGQVSRRHARITPRGGSATIEDLGSTNGTFVNDQVIHGPRPLVPGDRVRTGFTVIQLRSAQHVVERGSAAIARPPVPPPPPAPPPAAPSPAQPPAAPFKAPETPAGYVPPEVVGDPAAESNYTALSRLADARVKSRGYVAAFSLLAASALAVALVFGLD